MADVDVPATIESLRGCSRHFCHRTGIYLTTFVSSSITQKSCHTRLYPVFVLVNSKSAVFSTRLSWASRSSVNTSKYARPNCRCSSMYQTGSVGLVHLTCLSHHVYNLQSMCYLPDLVKLLSHVQHVSIERLFLAIGTRNFRGNFTCERNMLERTLKSRFKSVSMYNELRTKLLNTVLLSEVSYFWWTVDVETNT